MGQIFPNNTPEITQEITPENTPEITLPIPSRDSNGYKQLLEKLREIRKSMAIEDDFIIVESENV
jgi:hypothetical protein